MLGDMPPWRSTPGHATRSGERTRGGWSESTIVNDRYQTDRSGNKNPRSGRGRLNLEGQGQFKTSGSRSPCSRLKRESTSS
jgi:hypothetical protein